MTSSESLAEEHKDPSALQGREFASHAASWDAESAFGKHKADEAVVKGWTTKYRIELLLFALLFGSYAYFYQSTHHNEASRIDQMRAMLQNHTLEINKYWWNTADVIHYSKNGSDHIYPNKAPGMTLLSLGPFVVVSFVLAFLYSFGFPDWAYWHVITYLTTLLSVGLLSALAAVAIYRVLNAITGERYLPAVTVAAVWLGTLAFPYSTLFFSHQFVASLLVLAFYCLFRLARNEDADFRRQMIYAGAAGLLMGLSVASEYPAVLLAAVLFAYGVWVISRRATAFQPRSILVGVCIACGLVGGIMLLLYNHAAFGKGFYIPYESYTKPGADFSKTYSHGWLGLQWNGFRQFFHALASITVDPQIGMLYLGIKGWRVYACSPVLWLCLPGMIIMVWKRAVRPEGLVVLVMTLAYLLFITSYGSSNYDWSGASYFGSRHLIPLLPFLALPLYFGARLLRFLFYPLFAVSVFYMLIATATEPRVAIPYENTARDLLIPDYSRARFAQNTDALFDGQRNMAKDTAAFNFGKLVRLPNQYQLIPLLAWWLLVGSALLVSARKQNVLAGENETVPATTLPPWRSPGFPRAAVAGLAVFVVLVSLPPLIHHARASGRDKQHGLLGKYYRNATCSGTPTDESVDTEINFDWTKSLPLPPPFSVEWTGSIRIDNPKQYEFGLIADDGALLEIDGKTVVDVSKGPILQKKFGQIYLTAGLHRLHILYYNPLFGGLVKLSWIGPGKVEEIVPNEVLVPPAQTPGKTGQLQR